MRTIRARYLGLIVTITGLIFMAVEAHKTVHVRINGETNTVRTLAFTVGALLGSEQIPLGNADHLEPPVKQWLREGDTITIERAIRIRIQDNQNTYSLVSTERLPANLLNSAGIEFGAEDQLYHNGLPIKPDELLPRAPSISLQIQRAKAVRIRGDGQSRVIQTTASTVGQALWQAGIRLYAQDRTEPAHERPLDNPVTVNYMPSKEFRIVTQEDVVRIRTTEARVGSALAKAGIAVQGLDYSIPQPDALLPAEGRIRLVHVEEQVHLETEPLPFETEFQPAADLELDKQTVVQPGTFGIEARRVRVRMEDGKEVSRQEDTEFIAQEPKPRILGYGTKIVSHTTNTPGGRITYWRELNMYAVSYNPTSAGGNITASGLPLRKGLVAVDPTYIPLGTRLYIPGYGEALAADTGGGVNGRIIDLGYSDHDYVPWHQWVTVYFLWPPPENVVPVIP
ncbi:MAG TPA: ubiquitin-like domain-containing protein [Anaerolineales bacterium]